VGINDRLPKTSRRIIDLSRHAASLLQILDDGITQVKLEVPSIDAMNELYDQFEGEAPGTLRIRYFEEAVVFRKRPISWAWPIWYGVDSLKNRIVLKLKIFNQYKLTFYFG
jgi:Lipoproteins